jgi:outer membrane protein OmpA-like peptidoglycan-associated protein
MRKSLLKLILIPSLLLIINSATVAQDFLPVLNDNYMGINQALLQPAAIVDSRFKVDVNVLSMNNDIYNNMIRFNSFEFFKFGQDNWWDNVTYLNSPDGENKSAFVSQTLMGPSFLITLAPKHAIGFTYRMRDIINADDIGEPLARSIYDDFTSPEYWNQWYYNENLRAAHHIFAEYGLSYATEMMNTGKHYLKGGLTVNLLQGISGAYIQGDEFYYYFAHTDPSTNDADLMSWNSSYVNSGVSSNWNWGSNTNDNYANGLAYTFTAKPSVGLDLGFVYEFRPKYKDFRYDMDGKTDLERQDKNKYFLKIGVSVLDIGRLKYTKAYNSQDFTAAFTPDYLARYQAGDNSIPNNTHWMDIEEVTFGMPPYVNFSDTIARRAFLDQGTYSTPENEDNFILKLPTALSLQVDVHVIAGLYVNVTTYTGLHQAMEVGNSHYMSNYSLTPRYEHKWFGVSVPVQYNEFQKLNVGLAVRAAFVYFGINNLFSGLFDDPYGSNVFVGIKIPIFQGKPPADKDGDAVSDANDNCPSNPGVWEFRGCPDRDGDGVQDSEDLCPDVPGPKEFKGCPDRDGDGVADTDDLCPDQPGPKTTQGCPDRDGDGVPDRLDECPDIVGPATLNGCPDRDGDGVPDIKDKCPDVAGPVEKGGCPFVDTDGDGVKDADDRCPTEVGPPENNGCPYSDTDKDGVIDKEDKCPLTPGDPANFGCPVIKVEEAAVIKTAFENLEFQTGKAVISSSSFASLDDLATLLISKPTWKLKISGYTDNVGNDESNMTLSKNRAQATAKYLEGKGVPASQLVTEWFGENYPIADNSTPEGRQKNRRVEMQIVFD